MAHVSIREGKVVGLLGWVSFLSVCGSLYFLAAKSLGHQAKGLTVSLRALSCPKKSYPGTGSSGRILTPVSSVTECFPSPWLSLSSWEPQTDEAVTLLSLFPIPHNGGSPNARHPHTTAHRHHSIISHPGKKPTNDLIVLLAASLDRVTFSFLRALNFFRQSTVSCLCMHDATVARCCGERDLAQSSAGGKGLPMALTCSHTCVTSHGQGTGQSCLQQQQIKV